MQHQVAPWVVKAARAATTTELASLTTCLATEQAWHGAIAKRLIEPQWQAWYKEIYICTDLAMQMLTRYAVGLLLVICREHAQAMEHCHIHRHKSLMLACLKTCDRSLFFFALLRYAILCLDLFV